MSNVSPFSLEIVEISDSGLRPGLGLGSIGSG